MNSDPIEIFQELYSEGTAIRLLNVYKGLPIANEAKITAVGPGSIVVSSIKAQIVCMFLDRKTHIQSPALPQIVQADVLQFDTNRMEVRLGNMRFTSGRIGERKQVRVSPVDPVNSLVQPKNLRSMVKGELADISQSGLAIYLPAQVYVPEVFAVGTELIVQLTLPAINQGFAPMVYNAPAPNDPMARFNRENLRGTGSLYQPTESDARRDEPARASGGKLMLRTEIRNARREHGRVRIGTRLFPNAEAQAAVTSFITQRQSELVREVKTLYELLNKFEK